MGTKKNIGSKFFDDEGDVLSSITKETETRIFDITAGALIARFGKKTARRKLNWKEFARQFVDREDITNALLRYFYGYCKNTSIPERSGKDQIGKVQKQQQKKQEQSATNSNVMHFSKKNTIKGGVSNFDLLHEIISVFGKNRMESRLQIVDELHREVEEEADGNDTNTHILEHFPMRKKRALKCSSFGNKDSLSTSFGNKTLTTFMRDEMKTVKVIKYVNHKTFTSKKITKQRDAVYRKLNEFEETKMAREQNSSSSDSDYEIDCENTGNTLHNKQINISIPRYFLEVPSTLQDQDLSENPNSHNIYSQETIPYLNLPTEKHQDYIIAREKFLSFRPEKLGFPNPSMSNCCWLNASLQIILRMKFLIMDILDCLSNSDNPVLHAFFKVIKFYVEGIPTELYRSIRHFKSSLKAWDAEFPTSRQQDATEFISLFLSFLLSCEDLERKKNSQFYPKIRNNVELEIKKTLRCSLCKRDGKTISEFTNIFFIYVKDKSGISVQEGFDQEMRSTGTSQLCSHCTGSTTVQTSITTLPKYLIIQIVRPLSNNSTLMEGGAVELTPLLNVEKWIKHGSLENGSLSRSSLMGENGKGISVIEPNMLKLTGIIYHYGETLLEGHYVAEVFDENENEWLRFDDTTVSIKDSVTDVHGNSCLLVYTQERNN